MNRTRLLVLLILASFTVACDGDNSTSSNRHPGAGTWNIVFTSNNPGGERQEIGNADVSISPNGQVSGEARFQELPLPAGMHKYPLSGQVSNSGAITDAKFYDWANDIYVGSIAGTFQGNYGYGSYEHTSSGTWTANRIRQ